MRISRFLVPGVYEPQGTLTLEGDRSHYLKSVLRLKKGWKLMVFNGEGSECPATVETFGRDSTILRLETPEAIDRESPLRMHLALGVSRSERMDLALQKAVELGVAEITPLLTEFCVVRLDEERKSNRYQHWEGVIRSACEQSGRNWVPVLHDTLSLETWLETRPVETLNLFLDPRAETALKGLSPPPEGLTLTIGPEGGFSEREQEAAHASGLTPVTLGPRILRTETAVIAGLSACQALWGDLGASGA